MGDDGNPTFFKMRAINYLILLALTDTLITIMEHIFEPKLAKIKNDYNIDGHAAPALGCLVLAVAPVGVIIITLFYLISDKYF